MKSRLVAFLTVACVILAACAESNDEPAGSDDFRLTIEELEDLGESTCSDDPKFVASIVRSKSDDPTDIAHVFASRFGGSIGSARYEAAKNACTVALAQGRPSEPNAPSEAACEKTDRLGLNNENNGQILRALQHAYAVAGSATDEVRTAIGDAIDVFAGGPGDVTKALLDVGDACLNAQLSEEW